MDPESLINLLAESELLGERTAKELIEEFESSGSELFDFLEGSGLGDRQEILRLVAGEQGREFVDLGQVLIPSSLMSALPSDLLRIFEFVPIEVSEDRVRLCIVDPFDEAALTDLASRLGKPVEVVVADPDQIRDKLSEISVGRSAGETNGLVAASLGHIPESHAEGRGRASSIPGNLLIAAAVLAVAATATCALYLNQNRRLQGWNDVAEKNEILLREADAARKGWEADVASLRNDFDDLEKLLVQKEAEAIRVDGFEKELRSLRGKMESLDQILSKIVQPSGTENGALPGNTQAP